MAKKFTLWDLKKKTPSKTKPPITIGCSPKKIKLVDILEESKKKASCVNSARKLLMGVEATSSHLTREDNLLVLVSKLSFSTTSNLLECVRHVPHNFPRRTDFVHDIMNKSVSVEDIELAKVCRKSDSVLGQPSMPVNEEFFNLLWKSSFEKSTPYLCFLSRPVDSCVQCNRDLVERSVVTVTLYTMFGPFPGLKCSLRCTSCGMTYELDRSESPSQVFMLVISMIYHELKDVPAEELDQRLENYILSYDNMCHLDQLRAAKEDLPLPGPFKDMWRKIKKIIDILHLSNHKKGQCKIKYNPDNILPPGANTMATEQVFAWMSRYKKVVNSMTQTHHLFYLHRMCKRRNRYTGQCRRRGREPVMPGLNHTAK